MEPVNVMEFEALARARLGQVAWDYYDSGADDEITLRANRDAFGRIPLHYRVLVDVSAIDTRCRLLGHDVAFPLLIAPTAFHQLADPDGECATARAAARLPTIMVVSTLANVAIEEVARASSAALWFQLYVYNDRGLTEELVRRVEAAGCSALVVTVDAPVFGRRERDVRNRFALPDGLGIANLAGAELAGVPPGVRDSGLAAYFGALIDRSLTWRDIEWLRGLTRLPVVVKGIVRADDAVRAADAGAAAIVVSNHGGRQLDTSPATIDVLPAVAAAAGDRLEIYLDGGIRRGSDAVKAIALGARAVLVGRPVLWGLAAGGEDGVHAVMSILRDEFERAMALCGAPTLGAITRDLVAP